MILRRYTILDYTDTNTNTVVALVQAGNGGQTGLEVGLGWQVGARLTEIASFDKRNLIVTKLSTSSN